MALRTLDSAFWDDEDIAKLSFPARLLFVCMVTDASLSDDFGCLPAHARGLRKHAFGYDDDVTVAQVLEWRDEIVAKCRNVLLYVVEDQEYISLTKFVQWQQLRYQRKSNIPRPDDSRAIISENSRKFPQLCEKFPLNRIGLNSVGEDCDAETFEQVEPVVSEVKPTPPPRKKKIPQPDTRNETTAIKTLHTITTKYPPRPLWSRLIGVLGDTPDEPRLRECYETWLSKGYNPNAWTWALEWYGGGIPGHPAQAQPPRASPGPPRPPLVTEDWTQEMTTAKEDGNGHARATEQQTNRGEPDSVTAH
jgi:hypothetical protein